MPMLAFWATVTFISDVPEPGAAMEAGLKLIVTPEGWPVADKEMVELKPPETLVVTTA